MDGIWQSYVNLMNNPQQEQPKIYLGNRQPEVVNTRFTPQAIEQENRTTALIDAYQNGECDNNPTIKSWDREDIRDQTYEDFIAFSSLLARNFNNPDFAQYANDLGFYSLFKAYRSRNGEPILKNFFIRVANSKDLTQDYLNYMKDKIKRNTVMIDQNFEQYLQKTYNIIKDMFTANGFSG